MVFVTQKANAAELAKNLKEAHSQLSIGLLHGDMDQDDRNKIIYEFKKQEMPILVATDVAARGLDIPAIKTVVNYDVARDIDTHTHRIGRTGRAGEHGTAYTLVLPKDKEFCPHLVRNLESSNMQVPQPLLDLAMQVPWFKSQRSKNQGFSGGKATGHTGSGARTLGSGGRSRPGLGSGPGKASSGAGTYEGRANLHANTSGPQTDRVANLKQAFQNQFKSSFVSSSSQSHLKPSTAAVPNVVSKVKHTRDTSTETGEKKKKSRWDE